MQHENYYVPAHSPWPIVGAVAMFFIAVGGGLTVMQLNTEESSGVLLLGAGCLVLLVMLFGWFKHVDSRVSTRPVLTTNGSLF